MRKLDLPARWASHLVCLLIALAALTGCRRGSAKLEGHWKGVRAEGVDPSAQISAQAFAQGTEIIAQGDKIAIQTPSGRSQTTTYAIDKEDAQTLVIHTLADQSAETFSFPTERGDQMVWRVDEQRRIIFKKVP